MATVQRDFLHGALGHDLTDGDRRCFDERRDADDREIFGDRADAELHVQRDGLGDAQLNVSCQILKSIEVRHDGVDGGSE